MKSVVISVFAGLGKTTVGKKYANVCDLTSSKYRYDYSNINEDDYEKMKYDETRVVNPNWPDNYVKALIEAQEHYDVVLVPSNEDIRCLLQENKIDFIFVLPTLDSREVLLSRYKVRGNNEILIKEVMSYFDNWSRNQKDYDYPIVLLDKDKYLEDLLLDLKYISE